MQPRIFCLAMEWISPPSKFSSMVCAAKSLFPPTRGLPQKILLAMIFPYAFKEQKGFMRASSPMDVSRPCPQKAVVSGGRV